MVDAIVETARDLMREEGVASLNLNEVARRLGMKTPSLYEYFPNKLALYDSVFRLGTQRFRAAMQAVASQPADSPWEKLEQFLTGHLQFAVDYPELFKLVFERHVPGFVPSDASMAEAEASLAEADTYFRTFMQDAGLAHEDHAVVMRDMLIAMMHGVSSQHLANEPQLPAGAGRFGSLIPYIVETLKAAWGNQTPER